MLGQGHEHPAVHSGGRAVHRVIAPGLGAFEIKSDRAVAPNLHLDRDVVEPVGRAERLEAWFALSHKAVERVAAIDAGNRQLPGAGELAASALLDELFFPPPP